MILAFYFFRQFFLPFVFGTFLFLFVLILDRLFDIIDLIFNKGVNLFIVGKLFGLFIPTVLPLTFPMAILLASLVTFGRISEENELTAVRAAGVSLLKVLWLPPLFALILSVAMVPFNTDVAPTSNQAFRSIYERIVKADPLINIESRKFFAIKNIKILADRIDKKTQVMSDLFVYQINNDARPADRIFARSGTLASDDKSLFLRLKDGQLQRYDDQAPENLTHIVFGSYQISIPLTNEQQGEATRFRNIASRELKNMIQDLKSKGMPTAPLEAENSLRYALAFAPFCLAIVGIPLATALRRGGRTFGFGVTIVIVFFYYLLLIFGLTLAEKGIVPAPAALWIGNGCSLILGSYLYWKMAKK